MVVDVSIQTPSLHKFTAAEYERMAEVGIITEDERVELIEGVIIQMSPIGRKHTSRAIQLERLFSRTFGDVAWVSVQNVLRLSEDTVPQPDFVILRERPDRYEDDLPIAADALLVIEISDTSLSYDRDVKVPLYARFGVPEVWIVDVAQSSIHIYRGPTPGGYQTIVIAYRGESIALAAFPDRKIAVTEIVGAA